MTMRPLTGTKKANEAETDGPDDLGESTTKNGEADLTELWNNAIQRYCKTTKRPASDLGQIEDFEEAMVGTKGVAGIFDERRHPKTKLNEVMTKVEPCMEWIHTGAKFISEHAEGSFAAPAKAVAGAAAYLIKAAQEVKGALELVTTCFEKIKDAQGDISILQGLVPSHDEFHLRLMTVFTSFLNFCGFVTSYFTKGFRRRMYFGSLVSGKPRQLILGQCTAVEKAIESFRRTIPVSNLAVTVGMDRKVDNLPRAVWNEMVRAAAMSEFDPSTLIPRNDALKQIRKFFDPKGTNRPQAEMTRFKDISSYFERVSQEGQYKSWLEGREKPFLWVNGPSGCGKSYFIYSMGQKLRQMNKDDSNVLVASLFFRPGKRESQTLLNAFANIIVQVAEQDSKYGDQISKELRRLAANDNITKLEDLKDNEDPSKDDDSDRAVRGKKKKKAKGKSILWKELILEKFPKVSDGPSRTLYLLLDGLDQFDRKERESLFGLMGELSSERSTVHVLITSDSSLSEELERLNYASISLDETNREDVAMFIDARYKSSPTFKRFSDKTRKVAKETLIDKAKGIFAYVDVAMRRIEHIGRESEALEFLKKQSPGTEGLYKHMTENLINETSPDDLSAIQSLYKWAVFARRPLRIFELEQLLELETGRTDFSIFNAVDPEARGWSSSILYLELPSNEDRLAAAKEKELDSSHAAEETPAQQGADRRLASVSFLQGSFQEYLRKIEWPNKLIASQNVAKVEVFSLLSDVICGARQMSNDTRTTLQNYAVHNFLAHLMDIDINSTTESETKMVVEGVEQIVMDSNGASNIIEAVMSEKKSEGRWAEPRFDLYEQYNSEISGSRKPSQAIGAWIRKQYWHGSEDLSLRSRKWVKQTVQNNGSQLLHTLLRGHITSWFTKVTVDEALLCYKLICEAILEAKLVPYRQRGLFWYWTRNPTEKTVKCLEIILSQIKAPWQITPRARIALALLADAPGYDVDKASYALVLYEENLKQQLSGAERFYTLVGLAEYYFRRNDSQKAADNADLALKQHEKESSALGSDLDPSRLKSAFSIRAQALQKLGPEFDDTAIEVYEQALNSLSFSQKLVEFLDAIAAILSRHDEHLRLIAKVQAWPRDWRNTWLESRNFMSLVNRLELRKAAVHTRRADLLIRFYEDAIETFNLLPISLFLRYELAVIYRFDLRLSHTSKETLYDLLRVGGTVQKWTEMSGDFTAPEVKEVMMIAREGVMEICREQFIFTHNLDRKKELMLEVERLKRDVMVSRDYRDAIGDAEYDLVLAKMSADLGLWKETRACTNRVFKAAIDDLEDKIGGNDCSAFRLLGKVLGFVSSSNERLTADARIALSLQFSAVDQTYEDAALGSPPSSVAASFSSLESVHGFEGVDTDEEDHPFPPPPEPLPPISRPQSPPQSPTSEAPVASSNHAGQADTSTGFIGEPVTTDEAKTPVEDGASTDNVETKGEVDGETHVEKSEEKPEIAATVNGESESTPDATTEPPTSDAVKGKQVAGSPPPSTDAEHSLNATNGDSQNAAPVDINNTETRDAASTDITNPEPADAAPPDIPNREPPNAAPTNGTSTAPADPTPAPQPDTEATAPAAPASIASSDALSVPRISEDLEPYTSLACAGLCQGERYSSWAPADAPHYRCMECLSVDLCDACYKTQMEFMNGGAEGFWSLVCAPHHQYLQQPIEGWMGVKAGTIQTRDKKRKFREWLQDVKNRYKGIDWRALASQRLEAAQMEG